MRSHSNKASWNQQWNKWLEPFSSSRQTTPIQNSVNHGQVQNYGEQKGKQTVASTNWVETSNQLQEGNSVPVNIWETGSQQKIWCTSTSSPSSDVKQRPNKQQQVPTTWHQKKTTKTQAIQISKINGDKGQVNGTVLNRLDYSRSLGDECLQKEPFFVNHYYSHPVGQWCCQQHDITVRKGETRVQSSITPQLATTYGMNQKFTIEICRCMQHIKRQPGVGLAEIQDIADTIADKEGTALKSFLKGELVLSKHVWQQLIDLKFGVTVSWDEQITKQLEEGNYGRNVKTPEEEMYLGTRLLIFSNIKARHMNTMPKLLRDYLSWHNRWIIWVIFTWLLKLLWWTELS